MLKTKTVNDLGRAVDTYNYGVYSSWSQWSECSSSCKRGVRVREKICNRNISDSKSLNILCLKSLFEESECLNLEKCNASGYYLANELQSCNQFCHSKGIQCSSDLETEDSSLVFSKVLLNFTTANAEWKNDYGPYCLNQVCSEFKNVPKISSCNSQPPTSLHQRLCYCKHLEEFSLTEWSSWKDCSATCKGFKRRQRFCKDEYCKGEKEQIRSCGVQNCPVHGGFSEWGEWTLCSLSCNGGERIRTRACNNPLPQFNGLPCFGNMVDSQSCNHRFCPIDSVVSEWSLWSGCNKPCNKGKMIRQRLCRLPLHGGKSCPKNLLETINCHPQTCSDTFADVVLPLEIDYIPDFVNTSSKAFFELENFLKFQITSIYDLAFTNLILGIKLLSVKSSGVRIIINFANFDSYQLIFLQDSVEVDCLFGKLVFLEPKASYTLGPNLPRFPPTNVYVVPISSTSFNITWDPVLQTGDDKYSVKGYIVFYRRKLDSASRYSGIGSFSNSVCLIGLQPGEYYIFRVLAYTEFGNGIASDPVIMSTQEKLPDAYVKKIEVNTLDPFSVIVAWIGAPLSSMNGIPNGYNISYYSGNIYQNFLIVSFSTRSLILENLVPASLYVVSICAFNKIGLGPCQKKSFKTLTAAPSEAPLNLSVDQLKSHDTLLLHWKHPPLNKVYADLIAFQIIYKKIASGAQKLYDQESKMVKVHPSVTDHKLTLLEAYTTYLIEVKVETAAGVGPPAVISADTCRCPERVSSNFFMLYPYVSMSKKNSLVGVFPQILDEMINYACGECYRPSGIYSSSMEQFRNSHGTLAKKSSITKVMSEIDSFTDISFPIHGQVDLQHIMGYPYIPLLQHPGVVMITKQPSINKVVFNVVKMIFRIWPLLICNILLILLTGALLWYIDLFARTKSFATSFLNGFSDAVYFTWVTQTTVGYGDYVSLMYLSRVLIAVWMIVGIALSSLIVSSIVAALASVYSAATVGIYDEEIGALNGSYEQRLGLQLNGKVNSKKQYNTIDELFAALIDEDVKGVLLDAYTATAAKMFFSNSLIQPTKFIKVKRTYGFVLSGNLVNSVTAIKDFITIKQNTVLTILARSTSKMQEVKLPRPISLFDPGNILLRVTLKSLFSTLLLCCFTGYLISCYRKRKKKNVAFRNEEDWKNQLNGMNKFLDEFVADTNRQAEEIDIKYVNQRAKLLQLIN